MVAKIAETPTAAGRSPTLRGVRIDVLVARQAGVITLAQAVACGMAPATLYRRAAAEGWRRLHPAVYLVGGHRLTAEARVRAAALWLGDPAWVDGPAAAFWHGLVPAPDRVGLTVPRARAPRRRPGVVVRRRDLDRRDVTRLRGVPVTALPRTVLDTAVALPDGSAFLDRALQRHVAFPAVYDAYCRAVGCVGSARMATLLAACADRADSAAERLLHRLLRHAGIGGWVAAYAAGPYLIDVAFVAVRIAVEVDGWAWHADVDRFRADRRKGNALLGAGWTVLRFTWHDLDRRPAACVAEIRAALDRAA